jgi:hypothetical protein
MMLGIRMSADGVDGIRKYLHAIEAVYIYGVIIEPTL